MSGAAWLLFTLHLLAAKRFDLLSYDVSESLKCLSPHVGVESPPQVLQMRAALGVGRAGGNAFGDRSHGTPPWSNSRRRWHHSTNCKSAGRPIMGKPAEDRQGVTRGVLRFLGLNACLARNIVQGHQCLNIAAFYANEIKPSEDFGVQFVPPVPVSRFCTRATSSPSSPSRLDLCKPGRRKVANESCPHDGFWSGILTQPDFLMWRLSRGRHR